MHTFMWRTLLKYTLGVDIFKPREGGQRNVNRDWAATFEMQSL